MGCKYPTKGNCDLGKIVSVGDNYGYSSTFNNNESIKSKRISWYSFNEEGYGYWIGKCSTDDRNDEK
mgnify:CR=1 FL=1